MTHESIYHMTFCCNQVVRHEDVYAFNPEGAIAELEKLIPADYYDLLGFTVEELPQILQGQNL